MTFDELKKIKDEAEHAARVAEYQKDGAAAIGKIRREGMPGLDEILLPFPIGWNSNIGNLGNTAADAIKQALFDLLPDILRLAELRIEAERRRQSALARAKNAQIAGFLQTEETQ